MYVTSTQVTSRHREPPTRAVGRPGRQARAVRRDPTAPAERVGAARGDDRSHTPPHGDAVLPLRHS